MAPVKIHVVYCGAWGYAPKYEQLKTQLCDHFGADDLEFTFEATPTQTGYFEVTVNGKLIHSKKNGDGYVSASKAKLDKIIAAVDTALKQWSMASCLSSLWVVELVWLLAAARRDPLPRRAWRASTGNDVTSWVTRWWHNGGGGVWRRRSPGVTRSRSPIL